MADFQNLPCLPSRHDAKIFGGGGGNETAVGCRDAINRVSTQGKRRHVEMPPRKRKEKKKDEYGLRQARSADIFVARCVSAWL
jgi:hypothetical protein